MIAAAYTIVRYGHGEVALTGWGFAIAMVVFSCAAGSAGSAARGFIYDRALMRDHKADRGPSPSGGDAT